MLISFARRMLTEPDKRALWKFAYNFGYKGMRSVQRTRNGCGRASTFPPFLFISIINSANCAARDAGLTSPPRGR